MIAVVVGALLVSAVAVAAVPDTKTTVLRVSDLPDGFTLKKGYYEDNARVATGATELAALRRWGRLTGYVAYYSRDGLSGFLRIVSSTSVYAKPTGAAALLRKTFAELDGRPVKYKRVSMRHGLGAEARMYRTTYTPKNNGLLATYYVVVWRYRTMKAGLSVGGFTGTVNAAGAVALARKQQARIAAVLR